VLTLWLLVCLVAKARKKVHTAAGQGETTDGFHSFLETTILYNANRLDVWIGNARCLVKRALFRPPISNSPASESERPCVLGCCAAAERLIPPMVQSLVLKMHKWNVSQSGANRALPERREIVALASVAIRSSDIARTQLRSLVPSINPCKMLTWWRLLARPVTILRTLLAISRLLPNFRTVRFIPLKVPPHTKLQNHQIRPIAKAWQSLDLPSPEGRVHTTLRQNARQFRDHCSRELATHCEMQLLMRYEAEPSLAPTLAYFGCSKKSCFLCATFLALSPLKPRVRGRHGICHPNWAVPPLLRPGSAIPVCDRLTELCSIIKGQIMLLLQPRPCSPSNIVYQSSAVSELNTADMVEIRQRTANREAAEDVAAEHRDRMQIL
jgi:hypothetical protein